LPDPNSSGCPRTNRLGIHRKGLEQRAFPLVSRLLAGRDQLVQRALHRPQAGDLSVQLNEFFGREAASPVTVGWTARGEVEQRLDLAEAEAQLLSPLDETDDPDCV